MTLSVAVFDHEPDTRPWDDFWKWKASATMQASAPVWVASLEHDHIERVTDTGGTYNVALYVRPDEYLKQNPDEPAEVHFLVLWAA